MLVAQDLLFLLIAEAALAGLLRVGGGAFADAASTHENLGLQQQLVFTGFALHVVNRIVVLHICIKAKNHEICFQARRKLRHRY